MQCWSILKATRQHCDDLFWTSRKEKVLRSDFCVCFPSGPMCNDLISSKISFPKHMFRNHNSAGSYFFVHQVFVETLRNLEEFNTLWWTVAAAYDSRQWRYTRRKPHRRFSLLFKGWLIMIRYYMTWCFCTFTQGYALIYTSQLPSACRIPSSIQARLQPCHGRGLWFSQTIAKQCKTPGGPGAALALRRFA